MPKEKDRTRVACFNCGELTTKSALAKCPVCRRDGCVDLVSGNPGCMPGGNTVMCPECEEGREDG